MEGGHISFHCQVCLGQLHNFDRYLEARVLVIQAHVPSARVHAYWILVAGRLGFGMT